MPHQLLLGMLVKLLPEKRKDMSSVQFFMDGKVPENVLKLQEEGGGNNCGRTEEWVSKKDVNTRT